MPPKSKLNQSNEFREAHLGAVAFGLSKSAPSDLIRDPARDVYTGVAEDVHMFEGEHIGHSHPKGRLPHIAFMAKEATGQPFGGGLFVPDSRYCNFCGLKAQVLRTCSACCAFVCEQPSSELRACIPVRAGCSSDFLCPLCARLKSVKDVSKSPFVHVAKAH